MRTALYARRYDLWKRYILEGEEESTVVTELADEYEVTEETIQNDLATVTEWLPKLYRSGEAYEASALLALQENRHRLQRMAVAAQESEALELELRIRKELTKTINREKDLSKDVDFSPEKDKFDKLLEGY